MIWLVRIKEIHFLGVAFTATLLCTANVLAHPVAFEGATIVESFNTSRSNVFNVGYTFWRRAAIFSQVLRVQQKDSKSLQAAFVKPHLLLHRVNGEHFQFNTYAWAGAGFAHRSGRSSFAWTAGGQLDGETRRIYGAAMLDEVRSQSSNLERMSTFRLGFAPYLGDYEELSTWMIFQARHMAGEPESRRWDGGPLMRFYLKNVLWEVGATFRGSYVFNFMVHM